jgi:hypothetical protein
MGNADKSAIYFTKMEAGAILGSIVNSLTTKDTKVHEGIPGILTFVSFLVDEFTRLAGPGQSNSL